MKKNVLFVIQETEVLGKKIKMYGSVESPYFLASDVADWIDYAWANAKKTSRQTGKMLNTIDSDEKFQAFLGCNSNTPQDSKHGGTRENVLYWFVTEDGLYECCMQSRKPIAKEMKQEIKKYLRSIRLTGAAIPEGREEEMINRYFPNFSEETKQTMIQDLIKQNKELKQFYEDVLSTEGLMDMNTVAKELCIGEYKLFAFLRRKKIFFYNKENVNVPYERFRREGKFQVKETPCHDGIYRSVTYATKKGMDYIRKQLHKAGYYDATIA